MFDKFLNGTASEFANIVRKYDTWLWKTKYNDIFPKRLNDLLYIYGGDKFFSIIIDRLLLGKDLIINEDYCILRIKEEEVKKYIETKEANMKKVEINGLTAGIVFAESNISELGNVICENNPDIDFAMIINIDKSISFRTVKDNVDVSEIAKSLNGGGHKKAAGAPILEEIKDRLIKELLKI